MKLFTDLIRLKDPLIISDNPTGRIHEWQDRKQHEFNQEIDSLLATTYPEMIGDERRLWCSGFFKQPAGGIQRRMLTIRDPESALIGIALYDRGSVRIEGIESICVYLISLTILPPYQNYGIGKAVVKKLLEGAAPDILLSSCTQSNMLHCCVSLIKNGFVSGYDVKPYMDKTGDGDTLVAVTQHESAVAKEAFRQIYLSLTDGNEEAVNRTVANLSDTLVRKDMFDSRFTFDPWSKDGKRDFLAQALGLKEGDGMLVMITKSV